MEDDEGDALLVRECLLDAGAAEADVLWVRTVATGRLAIAEHLPQCVLLDLGLPDADGLSAVHQLVLAAADTPVIVLTGRNDRSTGDQAVAAGAQDYLVKDDITPDLLARAVRYAVERKRAQQTELQLRAEKQQSAENARLERGLLPNPQLRSDLVACTTYYQPGRNMAVLGGDFFDVVETEDGALRAVIGDVMGHGPDEAALGVHLRVAWRTLVLAGIPDDLILANLARLLHAETGGQRGFVTACDVTIRTDRSIAARVAGHPPPLVCTPTQVRPLAVEVGPPLGVEGLSGATRRWPDSGGWPVTRFSVEAGTSLLLYTDGLLESYRTSANRSSVGMDELVDATEAAVMSGDPASAWIPSLVGGAPSRSDDDTAVVVLTTSAHCSMTTSRRTRLGSWSLRRLVGRAFVAIVVLLAVLISVVSIALVDFRSKGDDVIDRWQPAYTLSQDVLADLVNQETGVRGYALGREDTLLQPYTQYLALQQANEAALRSRLQGRADLLADLDAVRRRRDRVAAHDRRSPSSHG